jgi:hypothetical protein
MFNAVCGVTFSCENKRFVKRNAIIKRDTFIKTTLLKIDSFSFIALKFLGFYFFNINFFEQIYGDTNPKKRVPVPIHKFRVLALSF